MRIPEKKQTALNPDIMKYSEIKNLESLEAEGLRLSKRLNAKGREVTEKFREARECYTPSGILSSGFKSLSSSVHPLNHIALILIRILKKRLA